MTAQSPETTIVFAVTVRGTDFGGDMSEAALWLESCIDRSGTMFETDVTSYRNAQDAAADESEKAGAWEV